MLDWLGTEEETVMALSPLHQRRMAHMALSGVRFWRDDRGKWYSEQPNGMRNDGWLLDCLIKRAWERYRQDLYCRYDAAVKRMDLRYDPIVYGRSTPENVRVKLGAWAHKRWQAMYHEFRRETGYDD